jgi:predicted kinase
MTKPTLYLLLGYPGAGKTTVSKIIHDLTGAVHLWADQIRRERFGTPTYSQAENKELYDYLNELTAELLQTGQSVIFDTNFNFYKDRQHLRDIAQKHHAEWVKAPLDIARKRAVEDADKHQNRVLGHMPVERFERMTHNLQEPRDDEKYLAVDGTKVSQEYISKLLHESTT